MSHRKIIPALLISVVAALSSPTFAQQSGTEDHSAHHPEAGKAKPSTQAKRGGKGMNGGMGDMGSCPMDDDMMGSKSSEERHAMMEKRIKAMTPEMRKKRMAMLEKHMQMMRDHMNDQPEGGAGDHSHDHQQ